MKFAVLGFIAALVASVSAQVINNASSLPPVAVAAPTTASVVIPTPSAVSACAVQSTFELCLHNEDNYIKTCQEQDFACLCRWNKEKLTCWNNCPNDEGFPRQEGLVSSLCSMPGANVSIAPWTSTIASTSTPIVQTSIVATSASTATTTPTNTHSAASALAVSQGVLFVVGSFAAYILF
ncbi:uncharacterized protein EV154DRAFT_505368 [Mucor mucedo]|uniref:Uncharacterized protein n=1 Tax=Mucor saturninus TaxID=64648 RepID=A0A8H7V4A7_9FUNG|nr:uncharacterized protein EV154DRAFT_505368 [Mucor mucedo]KAG2204967.1 hypothetical protein INT47_002591 [Mucor saturninus]KAI7892269.1 hypothetical protein EV154DRAFT_505368 [Mucor mucedo]